MTHQDECPAIVDLVGSCLRLFKDQIALSLDALREGRNTRSATALLARVA